MPVTYRNAIVHACPPVPSQVIQSAFPTMPQSIPDLCFPKLNIQSLVLMQLCSLHASGITLSLCNNQNFQRGSYRLPFHKVWGNPPSPGGHGEQGRRHLSDRETLRWNWTEGQNVQQQQQQQTKRAGDMQAGRICCAGCLLEQTLLFSPPSTSVLQLVTHCFAFSSTLLSTTMYVLSSVAFYSQSAHSHLNSPSPAKSLHGNSISPAAFTPLFWLLCVTPLSLVLLLQEI